MAEKDIYFRKRFLRTLFMHFVPPINAIPPRSHSQTQYRFAFSEAIPAFIFCYSRTFYEHDRWGKQLN